MHKNLPLLIGIPFLLLSLCASACINEYDTELEKLLSKRDPDQVNAALVRLELAYQTHPTHELANDLGAALVMAGRYVQAEDTLRAAEASKPGQPKTAFNLGTALELSGKNDEALRWIREGLRRDPTDHQRTEWLHAKILEAKIKLHQTPGWLTSNSVLGLSFGNGMSPETPMQSVSDATGKVLSLDEVQTAIEYQLNERLKFVSPPDPIVGDVFAAWGDIAWLTGKGNPTTYYKAALAFKSPNEEFIVKRLRRHKEIGRLKRLAEEKQQIRFWVTSSLIGIVTVVLLSWWLTSKRKFRARSV